MSTGRFPRHVLGAFEGFGFSVMATSSGQQGDDERHEPEDEAAGSEQVPSQHAHLGFEVGVVGVGEVQDSLTPLFAPAIVVGRFGWVGIGTPEGQR
jgi:hypothetical protein